MTGFLICSVTHSRKWESVLKSYIQSIVKCCQFVSLIRCKHIPFSPFPAPLVEGDALWENNLNNGGYNPTCLTLSRGLNDREHEKPVAQIRWLSSDP